MQPHHQRTIDKLTEHFKHDPLYTALIIGGSVAKGRAREDSDVDFMIIATDEEYNRRAAEKNFQYFSLDFCDYPGGYVDGKVINVPFLEEVADHGSEPARSAFVGAFITYCEVPGLEDLLARIPVYPEQQHQEKIRSFIAHLEALRWFVSEANKRQDPYLMTHAVGDLVLFGGRMILAHNRILYPYHKWFMTELRSAPQKPDNLLDLIEELLAHPCPANADQFYECIVNFAEWDRPVEGWPSRFMEDSEWNWRRGRPPVEDC